MDLVILFTIAFIYFMPTVNAKLRNTNNSSQVFVINLFLGWTFIFWVIALAMSYTSNVKNKLTV